MLQRFSLGKSRKDFLQLVGKNLAQAVNTMFGRTPLTQTVT